MNRSLLIAALLAVGLTACGEKPAPAPAPAPAPEAAKAEPGKDAAAPAAAEPAKAGEMAKDTMKKGEEKAKDMKK